MSERRIEELGELSAETAEAVLGLIGTAATADGQPAVSEQGRLHLRRGAGRAYGICCSGRPAATATPTVQSC